MTKVLELKFPSVKVQIKEGEEKGDKTIEHLHVHIMGGKPERKDFNQKPMSVLLKNFDIT